ncbi:flavodoxin domain-containing protein [Agarilytica rhodophyticola]|uniref:flavodoxin domain-containing protein n=1 Tax=Agarilytica rhodophyticola TaxID=1737490 RepID=UPI000B343911|nr:flavodoxin domain-containing protein [Agarilytica rhodophyticola]
MLPVYLIFGSVYGTAEMVATETLSIFENNGLAASILDESNWHLIEGEAAFVAIITSTTGAGDLPENIEKFYQHYSKSEAGLLKKISYSVLALGDSSYGNTFCMAGKRLDALLGELNATRIKDLTMIDACEVFDPMEAAAPWAEKISSILADELIAEGSL